jgi:hypothetical protein
MDGIQEQIDTLVKIDNMMEATPERKQDSPVSSVETALSEFVKDSFDVTRRDYEFNDKIQEEIAKRLDEFSNSELILLLTNNKVNDSDRLSKMLAPSFQMLTAKQQAEITAASQEKQAAIQATGTVAAASSGQASSVKDMSDSASTELLKGMSQLSHLLSAITVSVKEKTN